VDDELPVPQAVSSVLAAHAPVQGFSAFNMSDHALGCLCMTCEALRRQASSNQFTNGQTHNADGRPFIAYVPPLRDPSSDHEIELVDHLGPGMFRPRDIDQEPENPVDAPHTGDFQAEAIVIEVPGDSESEAGNGMTEEESHAGDPRESVPTSDIREVDSDSPRSQSYRTPGTPLQSGSPRSLSYRTPGFNPRSETPPTSDSTPSPCWCENEIVRL
jgi:hypothetical protein